MRYDYPTISACIPTAGRASLAQTLASAYGQWRPGDEFVVCCDRRAWQPDDAWRAMVWEHLPPFVQLTEVRFAADHQCYGHCVLSIGLHKASAEYVIVQDDDDIWTPGAFDAIRRRALENPGAPLIFRFRTHYGYVVPPEPGSITRTARGPIQAPPDGVLAEGFVGGHCLVQPNVKAYMGRYSCRYSGDWEYVAESVTKWQAAGIAPVACPELIAWARPTEREYREMFPQEEAASV